MNNFAALAPGSERVALTRSLAATKTRRGGAHLPSSSFFGHRNFFFLFEKESDAPAAQNSAKLA